MESPRARRAATRAAARPPAEARKPFAPSPTHCLRFIGPAGSAALLSYRYTAVDRSLLAPYLQPYWAAVVRRMPLWVAPNCITSAGLCLVLASFALSALTSPTLDAPVAPAVILLHAALLFAYQTLDAVDGKQARRTGSSGPLGELCDHTCDALVSTFGGLPVAATLMTGTGGRRTVLACMLVGTAPFALATWRMLLTGVMTLPEFNGPNEGLALLYTTHLLTALVGQERLWLPALHLPYLGAVRRQDAYAAVGLVMTAVDAVSHVSVGFAAVARKGGSRRRALALLAPYAALVLGGAAWAHFSPADVGHAHPHLFIAGFGCAFALLMGRLILAHLTGEGEDRPSGWRVLALLPLAVANAAAPALLGLPAPPLPELWLLWAHLALTAWAYADFAAGVTGDICSLLRIRCFSLKRG